MNVQGCAKSLGGTSAVAVVMVVPATAARVVVCVRTDGFRILTGASREPAMVLVSNMIKVGLIVFIACSLAIANAPVRSFLTTDLSNMVNCVVNNQVTNCSSTSIADKIDENLAYTQIAMAAIDAVQVPYSDQATNEAKAHTMLIATLGTASPSMTAGAMLLLYQVAMALLIGLAPIFIMCLMFEQTKQLFQRWLMFTISTVFSMAVLSAMVSIAMKASINTAVALWVTQGVAHLTSMSTEGYSSQAMQQGGIGLLMTVLIVSTPPMAGMLFNGTLGNFMTSAQVGGAGGYQAASGQAGGGQQGGWYSVPGKASGPAPSYTQNQSTSGPQGNLNLPQPAVGQGQFGASGDKVKKDILS